MKSRTIGYLLLAVTGVFGGHRLYAGRPGAWMALTSLGLFALFILGGVKPLSGVALLAIWVLWLWDMATMWKWKEFEGSEK